MFEEAGHLYVYLSYGLHYCANIVTEATGVAGAVLLRAAAAQSGVETVRQRRLQAPRRGDARGWRQNGWQPTPQDQRSGTDRHAALGSVRPITDAALLRGPGNLCRGLGIQLNDNGLDICAAGSRLRVLPRTTTPPLARGRRVGVSAAVAEPLRFSWAGHPAVSRPAGRA
jgi:DNA-3-methyladenine glycosylase